MCLHTLESRGETDFSFKGRTHSSVERRLDALSAVAEGVPVSRVAEAFAVSRQTIHNWMARVRGQRSLSCLANAARCGRPPRLDEEALDFLRQTLEEAPDLWNYASSGWTVELLQQHLKRFLDVEVSTETVRLQLRALGFVWKRPRYVLKPDPLREKKIMVEEKAVFIA